MRRRAPAAACPGYRDAMVAALDALAAAPVRFLPGSERLTPGSDAAIAAAAQAVDDVHGRLCMACPPCEDAWLIFVRRRLAGPTDGDPRTVALAAAPYARAADPAVTRLTRRLVPEL